jgi:hypothetical protein
MGENKMKHHEYATEVKHTLEKDIKKILIDTKHLTDTDKIILFEQTVGIFPMYPQLTYYGTFKAIFKDDFIIGEFQHTNRKTTIRPKHRLRWRKHTKQGKHIPTKISTQTTIRDTMKQCEGCEEEFGQAIMYQDDNGLYFATSIDREIEDMTHFTIWMVDDDGKEQVW